MRFWCVAKNNQEPPEDGVDKHRNASELNKWLAYKKYALIIGYVKHDAGCTQRQNKKQVSYVQSL